MQQIMDDLKRPEIRRRLRQELDQEKLEDAIERERRIKRSRPKMKNPHLTNSIRRVIRHG